MQISSTAVTVERQMLRDVYCNSTGPGAGGRSHFGLFSLCLGGEEQICDHRRNLRQNKKRARLAMGAF